MPTTTELHRCQYSASLPIIGITPTPVVLPSALQRRRWIATSHDDLPGDPHKSSRNLMLPATFDEHEDDTIHEHEFVHIVSPSWPSAVA